MAEETITNAFIKFRLPGTLPSILLAGGSVTRTLNSFTAGPPNYVNFIGGPIGYNSSLTYTIYAVETGVTLHVVATLRMIPNIGRVSGDCAYRSRRLQSALAN